VVSVTALKVGLEDHSGIPVSLVNFAGVLMESGVTDASGDFTFGPSVSDGAPYTVVIDGEELDVIGSQGAVSVDPFVFEGEPQPTDFLPGIPVVSTARGGPVQRDGNKLYFAGVEVSTDLRPDGDIVVYSRTETHIYFNESDCTGACPLIEVTGSNAGAVTGTFTLSAQFPVERLQVSDPQMNFNPIYADFSTGLNPMWVERLPGGFEAELATAEHLLVWAKGDRWQRWFDNGDGTETVTQYRSTTGSLRRAIDWNTQVDLGIDAVPRLYDAVSSGANGMAFDAAACGREPWAECAVWGLADAGQVEFRAGIYLPSHRGYLEADSGGDYHVADRQNSTAFLAQNLDIAWPMADGEPPVVDIGNQLYTRGAAGLVRGNSLVLADALRMFTIPGDQALVWTADEVHLISGGSMTQLMAGGAQGNEAVFDGDLVFEREWADCPGGPCTVIWTQPIDGSPETPHYRGEIYLDRSVEWVPMTDDATVLLLDVDGQPARVAY